MSEQDRSEFIEAAKAAAFTVDDEESSDHGRSLLHCFAGGFLGADWDLGNVLSAIASARDVQWRPHLINHDLTVLTDEGRLLSFDVKTPVSVVSS